MFQRNSPHTQPAPPSRARASGFAVLTIESAVPPLLLRRNQVVGEKAERVKGELPPRFRRLECVDVVHFDE